MTRDSRYDILFEPVRIGPLTARNRFYQVPHCNGMGHRDPSTNAHMRGMKAEGGWAVVCTEMCEIDPTADVTPYVELRLWDDRDIPMHRRITEKIHAHGALAGLELCHSAHTASNLWSREVPIAVSAMPVSSYSMDPTHARAMDKDDIRNLRRSHRQAALRGREAGYDLIYVYAGHGLGVFQHFLSRATNQRTDEYGGSLANRARLLREVIEETKEAVGATCAVPVRIAMAELMETDGLTPAEVEDAIGLMAELPDLWDLSLSAWEHDSQTSRFSEEGFQEQFIRGVKKLTSKPVVGVGRYTSPDTMVRVIRQGIMDMIGAARPSIADPFLPAKIQQGRLDDIRECIGCNICVTGDYSMSPSRCTQNPAMGEEFRRGWHPENIRPAKTSRHVLVVGAGPAGLEAARALGQRGHKVTIADAAHEPGGRVALEARLPGLSAWGRVRDWRLLQINKMANVSLYLESEMTAETVTELEPDDIVLATGSRWRRNGTGRYLSRPVATEAAAQLLTPDDILSGVRPTGKHVVIYDDDHYYMGGVLAELLAKEGFAIAFVTPAPLVSTYTKYTMEQPRIQRRLIGLGVEIIANTSISRIGKERVALACTFSGAEREVRTSATLLVTSRDSKRALADELKAAGHPVNLIGDCLAPSTIAAAVHSGRRYAEEHGEPPFEGLAPSLPREVTRLS